MVDRIVSDDGGLAHSLLGDRQEQVVGLDHGHGDDVVLHTQGHSLDPSGVPSHRTDLCLAEPAGLTVVGSEDDLVGAVGLGRLHQFVVIVQFDGLDTFGPDISVVMVSPSCRSFRRLTMGLPLACLLPSGMLYPLSQRILPVLVTNIR